MADLGTAYVNIVPKAPGIEQNVENLFNGSGGEPAEKAGSKLGQRLKAGFKTAAVGTAVLIGKTIKQALDAGGALQQSFGGLDTIYGEAAAGAKAYAMQASQAGISANTYAEQAVSFGAALKAAYSGDTTAAMEAANLAILDMADNAAKMGTPIESLQNAYQGFAKQNYTMLDNLKLGYGGTKTEMERLLADAQAISGVEYNIDNLGDVYSAIHVIQGELGLTGVAANEAKTTLTGSAAAMKASWENVLAALTTGEDLETALQSFTESFGAFGTNVINMLAAIAPQLPTMISGLADVIIQNSPVFVESGVSLIAKLIVGLITSIPAIIAALPQIWYAIKSDCAGVDWAQVGRDIIAGIIRGLSAAAGNLLNWMRSLATQSLNAAKIALGIGSPSKVFANEVGRWIPPGVAMGVEENMGPLDRAMRGMADGSLAAARGEIPTRAQTTAGSDADRIIAALDRLSLRADVRLQGEARGLFRVVRQANNTRTRATNYNALAAGGA